MRLRRIPAALLLAAALESTTSAQWHSAGRVDAYRWTSDREVTVTSGPALLSVRLLADDLVRIRFTPHGTFAPDRSRAVIRQDWPVARPEISDSDDRLTISSHALRVTIRKNPLRLVVEDSTGTLLCADDSLRGMSWAGHEIRVWKQMPPDEHYFGFGEKAGMLDRSGTHMAMWNSDIPAYTADTDPLYESIPLFMGIRNGRAYGIFLDNSFRSSFDMGKECRDAYAFGVEDGELNYYVFAGPTPRSILARYGELTGRMPLPPRWALGYQQSRWSYPSETRVREIARGFRERRIPCDVIYLDIDYMDGYRIFTWNTRNFPDPPGMIGDLGKDGFKIAVIVDPGIKFDSTYTAFRTGLAGNHFVRYPDGRLYTGKVWPGVCAFPDFTDSAARGWWGKNFEGLVRAGVRGFWTDMNEPSVFDVPTHTMDLDVVHNDDGLKTSHAKNHNVYGLEMTRATREGIQRLRPDERVFVLTRASYAGGQRYAAAWTGDNVASWEHLGMALRMCLSFSLSGQPFVGSDIGGFIGAPSGELFARWLQLGVFTPLMRGHSVINEKNKEPWEYGAEFTDINRATIALRYRFLPYIYTVMREASETGLPPMRMMALAFPDQPALSGIDDAFMFGSELLVAPVLGEGMHRRAVRLPAGTWYNWWSDSAAAGGKEITVDAPLGTLPLFARAGAIVPMQQPVQYSDQAPIDPLTIVLFPPDGNSASAASYYEDDGHSMRYREGEYFLRTIEQRRIGQSLTVTLHASQGSYTPPKRSVILEMHAAPVLPSEVRHNGIALKKGKLSSDPDPHWTYDSARRVISVKISESRQESILEVEFPKTR